MHRMADSIVQAVIQKFQQRSELGQKKYGVTLDRTDLSPLDWIQHAQDELMDGILYLERLKKTYVLPVEAAAPSVEAAAPSVEALTPV